MGFWAGLGRRLGLSTEPLPSPAPPDLLDRMGFDQSPMPLTEAQQAAREVFWLWDERRIDAAGVRRVAQEILQRIDHLSLGDQDKQTFVELLTALKVLAEGPWPYSEDLPAPVPACLGRDEAEHESYPPFAENTEHFSTRPPKSP